MSRKQFAFVVGPCRTRPSFHHWAHLTLLNGPASPSFSISQALNLFIDTQSTLSCLTLTSIISKKKKKRKGENSPQQKKKSFGISQGLVNLIKTLVLILFSPHHHLSFTSMLSPVSFYILRSIVFCYTLSPSTSRAVQLSAV